MDFLLQVKSGWRATCKDFWQFFPVSAVCPKLKPPCCHLQALSCVSLSLPRSMAPLGDPGRTEGCFLLLIISGKMQRQWLICSTDECGSIGSAADWHFIRPVPIADIDPAASQYKFARTQAAWWDWELCCGRGNCLAVSTAPLSWAGRQWEAASGS